MNTRCFLANVVFALVLIFVSDISGAAESRKLAAPVYPGSVPAVPAEAIQADSRLILVFDGGKTLDCNGTTVARDIAGQPLPAESSEPIANYAGPWCFLSRDPIEKVRAFYEKSAGTLQPVEGDNGVHGYQTFTERAWFPGDGEASMEGYGHVGVSLHAFPPPRVKGQEAAPAAMGDQSWPGQEDYGFYAQTRFFGAFLDAVDFFGDPSKRPPSDLDKLYAQRNKVESALFQRKGPTLEAVDETVKRRYGDLRAERQQAAHTGTMSAYMQHGAQAAQSSAGPTAAEDEQFNAVMADDPGLQQRYVALTQKGAALMQQGKFDEADAVFAEIDELEQAHPELAALNSQQQARAAKAQAADKAAEDAIRASGENQLDQAIWGTGLEMLDALDKEAYYTLIVIDNGLTGSEKDYSRDRGIIEAETAGTIPHTRVDRFGISYPNAGPTVVTAGEQAAPENKENVRDKLKKGLGRLKDLGGGH